jgi:hypothetical protein
MNRTERKMAEELDIRVSQLKEQVRKIPKSQSFY